MKNIITWKRYQKDNALGLISKSRLSDYAKVLEKHGFENLKEFYKEVGEEKTVEEIVQEIVVDKNYDLVIYEARLKKGANGRNWYIIWVLAKKS